MLLWVTSNTTKGGVMSKENAPDPYKDRQRERPHPIQQKRKSSILDDTFLEKKPALNSGIVANDHDLKQCDHLNCSGVSIPEESTDMPASRSVPSSTLLSLATQRKKLPQCEGLLPIRASCSVSSPYFGSYTTGCYENGEDSFMYRIELPERRHSAQFLASGNDGSVVSDEHKEIADGEKKNNVIKKADLFRSDAENDNNDVFEWIVQFQNMRKSDQYKALTTLVNECSLGLIRHMQKAIEPFFQKDFIKELPKEIALLIMSFLPPSDIASVSRTCHYWHNVAEEDQLWRKKCKQMNIPMMNPPSERRKGAWAMAQHLCNVEIVGELGTRCSGSTSDSSTSCRARSKWKSLYLRHKIVQANWRYRSLRASCILRGHEEHVITCLQIHGDLIITGSDDNTLKIWSAIEGMCMHTLIGHSGGVWSSQLSEDNMYVASGSTDRTVRIWSVETGHCLHLFQGHTSTVRCMALKDYILVSGSRDTTIRIWNLKEGRFLRVLHGHIAAVRCVQFDGRRIVSGAYDFSVKVWDAEIGCCLHTLTGHTNRVYSLLFDSERDIVVSGSLDTTIRVWDVKEGRCTQTLIGHQSLTSGMQLKGNILVSGNADSTIRVWDILDGQCKYTLSGPNRHASAVTSLQFLDHGLIVSSSDDGTVKLWDANRGAFVRDLVRLRSGGSGGCIWRLKSTPTMLVCAVGSRNGTEDTKLILLDFDIEKKCF